MEADHPILAATGRIAFTKLWRTFVTAAEVSLNQETWIEPLTQAWLTALSPHDTRDAACAAAAQWLDAASRRQLELDLPVAVLSRVRRLTHSTGLFPEIYFHWGNLTQLDPRGSDRRHALLKALDRPEPSACFSAIGAVSTKPWMTSAGFLLPSPQAVSRREHSVPQP